MIFDLFYNQFVQVIDSVELAGGAIFRTILTDYNLPDWSRIRISWKLLESNPLLEPAVPDYVLEGDRPPEWLPVLLSPFG